MSFVIDASIVVGFAFGEAPNPKIALAIDELAVGEALTPSLFFFEVRNALVVNERRGLLRPKAPRISSGVWRGCQSGLRRRPTTMR